MLLDDRRMKVRKIAKTIGISKESVGYILHEELDMKKLCVHGVISQTSVLFTVTALTKLELTWFFLIV